MPKKKGDALPPQGQILLERPMDQILHDSMLPYAEHVILERALPRVEDGLKPVQRRILYTMLELGVTPDKPHRKSARIVGDCLGKYHPHGESSVYDAMVRMAQDFNMRAMLVDGHGNFGSVDGDSAAAMRYTEVRMTEMAMEMLRDLEKDTVDWSLNFDDTLHEPDQLPGRFPNLLVNGATGIAVGLATNIPTHNLGEAVDAVLVRLDRPDCTVRDIMNVMPAPDFPTGGDLVDDDQIELAYRTGRGRLTLRAKVQVENGSAGKKLLVIHELPYQVNKAAMLEKILKLREEKKSALTAITDIRDESDREGMRAVIELKKDSDADAVLAFLFKYSDLQVTFGVNMVAIMDGKPLQMGVLTMLDGYIRHQENVVTRRTRYDLEQARKRAHVLQGLMIAVDNLDEVIRLIRASKSPAEAKSKLMNAFQLSDVQAQAILDMRLQRLTGLEILALRKEYAELLKTIAELESILKSEKKLKAVIKKELMEIRTKYADPRRTTLIHPKVVKATAWQPEPPAAEDVCVLSTCGGYLKRMPLKGVQARAYEPQQMGEILRERIETATDKRLLLFTNLGNCYGLDVAEIAECRLRDRGTPFSGILPALEPGETCIRILECGTDGDLLFVTEGGMLKRTAVSEYGMRKTKMVALKLRQGDVLLEVFLITQPALLLLTRSGMAICTMLDAIPQQGRVSQGVKGMDVDGDDHVFFAAQHKQEGELLLVTDRGYAKRNLLVDHEPQKRGGSGLKAFQFVKNGASGSRIAYAAVVTDPACHILWLENGDLLSLHTEEMPIEKRFSKGVPAFVTIPGNGIAGGCLPVDLT